jgi:hypothetical protein
MDHIVNSSKLTWRPGRRLLAIAGLACAALVLPAAALAASAGPGAASARASRCGAQTMAWMAETSDSGAGSARYWLEISNVGRATCTLSGYPRVIAVGNNGHQVGKPAAKAPSARPVLTLRPRGTVHVVLQIGDPSIACPSRMVVTSGLLVSMPGQAAGQFVPFPSGACPGESIMSVDAVHPGVGIPLHTFR